MCYVFNALYGVSIKYSVITIFNQKRNSVTWRLSKKLAWNKKLGFKDWETDQYGMKSDGSIFLVSEDLGTGIIWVLRKGT